MSRDAAMEQKMGLVGFVILLSILKFPYYFEPSTIRGHRVLLTDSDSTLGREVALTYAKHKTELFLVSRNETDVRRLADLCLIAGAGAVHTWTGDLSDPADREELMEEASIKFGGQMNQLVMNHYQDRYETSSWASDDGDRMRDLEVMMNRHFRSYVELSSMAVPLLTKRRGGIGAVMPLVGKIPVARMAAYSASYAAVTGFFPALRQELWRKHSPVSVTSIAIGHVNSVDGRSSVMGKGYPFPGGYMATETDLAADEVVEAVSLKKSELTYPFVSQVTYGLYSYFPTLYEYIYTSLL